MAVTAGGDLRAVRHGKQLSAAGQTRKTIADRAGHGTADAAVNFVEDDRCRATLFGKRDLQREDEAREFAARGDLAERGEIRAGVGRDQEFDGIDPARAPAVLGQSQDRGVELGGVELERSQFGRNRLVDPAQRALFDDLQKVIRGPLLAPGRLAAIWRLNTRSAISAEFAPPADSPTVSRSR